MLPLDVNDIVNKFKRDELKGKSNHEIYELFEQYCYKNNQSVTDGIKIGYLYAWTLMITGGFIE